MHRARLLNADSHSLRNNCHHRKAIMASFVKGVYTLESERNRNRALAPKWWEFFNFELARVLEDEQDESYFGAIFKSNPNHTGQGPPTYVIAFRGTVNKPGNVARDYKQNRQVFLNKLKSSPRVEAGMEAAENLVRANGPENVWLAGHSAGSSIALLIGRKMVEAKEKHHLQTYLFNPPFLSFPIERIKNENLKDGVRLGKSFLTAGLACVANGGHRPKPENDPFIVLSTWAPHLFVNKSDPICSNYVGYFEHREKMERMGFGKIGKISTQHSIRSIMYHAIGKDSEPIHLLPSANLVINTSPASNMRKCEMSEAHGIDQWWKPDLQVDCKLYEHK